METRRRHDSSDRRWLLIAVGVVVIAWLVPLAEDPRRYFSGDTEAAYLGWWYQFGHSLLGGHWPYYDAQAGSASNPLAEGQWGLYSPLIALIGIGAALTPNVVVYATVVKFLVVVLGVVGSFLLARSFDVRAPLAAVAATALALCGQTLLFDGPAWFNGLVVCALLPWTWWGIRRTTYDGRNPLPALVAGYLLVSTGYVYGTIFVVIVLAASLVEALLLRRRRAFGSALLIGVVLGLVAVTVYLPGVLTADVTTRSDLEVGGEGPWRMLASSYLLAGQPVLVPGADGLVGISGGPVRMVPFTFIAWFLPLLAWVSPSRLRGRWRELSALALVLVVCVAWTLGPYAMGPIRWPARIMPVVALVVVLALVILLDRTLVTRPSRTRLVISLVWALAAGGVAILVEPSLWGVELVGALLVVVGLVAAWWASGRPGVERLGAVLALGALVVASYSLVTMPDLSARQRSMPSAAADYERPASDAVGDVLVIGQGTNGAASTPAMARSLLYGSTWYLSGRPVRNLYSTIGFGTYNRRFCVRYYGGYCAQALQRMFAVEPVTGRRRVDLQAISTIILARDVPGGAAPGPRIPPDGWRVVAADRFTVTWVRDRPVPTAGGVVWSSPGTTVRRVAGTDASLTFDVEAVPAGGGKVVLSRLAWPGYRIDGATFGDPLEGYQMVVDVPASAEGTSVTVTFRPPGWTLELATLGTALLVGAGWTVLAAGLSRRRRRAASPRTHRS